MRKRLFAALATVVIVVGGGIALAESLGTAGELKYIEEWKSETLSSSDRYVANKAHCPRDRHVTGGGYQATLEGGGYVGASMPFDDGDADNAPDDGWFVSTYYSATSGTVYLTVYAICDN